MKCRYCGGEIKLEDMVCPYCGRPNEEAARHAQDMRRYQYEFQETRHSVEETAGRSAARTAKVTVLAVLIILIGVNIFLQLQSSSIVWSMERRAAAKKAPEYEEELAAYLEEGDYIGFCSFVYAKQISCYEPPYEAYYRIYRAANHYKYAVEQIEKLVNPARYSNVSHTARYLKEYIDEFYESLKPEQYSYYDEGQSEDTEKHIEAMKKDLEAMYIAYLGMTEEEAASMESLSGGNRMVLIEKGLARYLSGGDDSDA